MAGFTWYFNSHDWIAKFYTDGNIGSLIVQSTVISPLNFSRICCSSHNAFTTTRLFSPPIIIFSIKVTSVSAEKLVSPSTVIASALFTINVVALINRVAGKVFLREIILSKNHVNRAIIKDILHNYRSLNNCNN